MIKIEGLKKHYQSFDLNCTMEVQRGRITGLIGQNGAGKSTTFKAILGLIPFDDGKITLLGKDVKDITARDRQRMGVVLSDSGFSGYLTVKDIISVLKGLYPAFDQSFFVSRAQGFGLPMDKKIKDYSTGMKAKLKLLVAVSHNADLLILDEPTAGLDVIARDELLLLLREYLEVNEDRAVLISSHISSDLEALCDDIYMINKGSIILHEDTDVLLDSYAILKAEEARYAALDKQYILAVKRETYGYSCLTDQRRFYAENYPSVVLEKATIDAIITMMIKGDVI